ncbi:MAG TPA: hypothetical protein VLK30_05250 [Candidatus Limnocylindrales bacterium]|nr:hypothetical protein [Candidatus Limnocylindrales bacterium]
MSDTSPAYPSPPPQSIPPPVYQPPPGSAVPTYQPPPMAQPPVGYPQTWQQQPWQPPQAGIGAGAATAGVLSQFTGSALWACIIGLITIIVPFAFGRVFFFLPIIGVITGVRAVQQGKLIGGLVGIVLSAIGGVLTLIGLFA